MPLGELWEKAKHGTKVFTRRLTTRDIDEKLDHYSDTYGEILLGMHRNIESQHAEIARHNEVIERHRSEMADLQQATRADREAITAYLANQAGLVAQVERLQKQGGQMRIWLIALTALCAGLAIAVFRTVP